MIGQGVVIVNILPSTPEYVQRLGKEIIVYQSGVDREDSHEKYYVASPEENIPDLVVSLFFGEFLLEDD